MSMFGLFNKKVHAQTKNLKLRRFQLETLEDRRLLSVNPIAPSTGDNVSAVTVVYAISGADAGNYITPVSDSALASITNADFEIELTGYTGTYDGDAHTISVAGLLEGDTIVYRYNGFNYSVLPTFTHVGTYSIGVTISRANYADWTGSVDIVISPKQLTVSGTTVADKTFDGTTVATVTCGTLSGVVTGETVSVSATGTFADPNVGQQNVTVVYTISGADAGNYKAPINDFALVLITPATLSGVTVTDYAGTYDGDAHTISVDGLAEGDTVVYRYNGESFTSAPEFTDVGTYAISVTVSRANYNDWTGSANVVISQKQLTISGTSVADKTYDGTTSARVNRGLLSGVVIGETVSVSAVGTFADPNVGQNKSVTVVYAISGADAGNYKAPVSETKTASITNADFEIELTGYTGIYDGDAHTISVDGRATEDKVVYNYNGFNYSVLPTFTNVGTYTIGVTVSRANYNDWTGSADVVISQKQLTVSGTSVADKTYDGKTTATITLGTVSGIVSGDSVTVTPNGAFPSADAGTYDVIVRYALSGNAAANYLAPTADTVSATIIEETVQKISVMVVLSDSAPTETELVTLPESITSVTVGATVYTQVWVMNMDGSELGTEGGYVDITYTDRSLATGVVTTSPLFPNRADSYNVSVSDGLITTYGGYAVTGHRSLGTTSWVLLASNTFTATMEGIATVGAKSPTLNGEEKEELNLTRVDEGTFGATEIVYHSVSLNVIHEPESLATPTFVVGNVASYGANRHSATWGAVAGAVEYELAYSVVGSADWTTVKTSDVSAVVSGLIYGAKMSYKVRAIGDNVDYSDSDWSETLSLYVCPMDVDGDGRVGPADRTLLASAWLARPSSSNWDVRCDIDGNKTVASGDRTFLTSNYLKAASASNLSYPPALAEAIFADDTDDAEIDFDIDYNVFEEDDALFEFFG